MEQPVDTGTGARDHAAVPESPRLLIVDDEPFVVKIAQRVLEREGFTVLSAGDGEGALSMVAAHPDIALILLDSNLPDMNAEEVLQRMADRGFITPVLLSSGFGADSLPSSDQFANVRGFLPKPYAVAQLSAVVRELISPVEQC